MSRSIPWSRFSADPRRASHRELRASDRDRNIVLDILGDAFAEGKLDEEEFSSRSQLALTAATLDQCYQLIVDLVANGRKQNPRANSLRRDTRANHQPAATYTRLAVAAGVTPLAIYLIVRALGGMSGGWEPPAVFWILTLILVTHAGLTIAARPALDRVTRRLNP